MWSQRVGHDWASKQHWSPVNSDRASGSYSPILSRQHLPAGFSTLLERLIYSPFFSKVLSRWPISLTRERGTVVKNLNRKMEGPLCDQQVLCPWPNHWPPLNFNFLTLLQVIWAWFDKTPGRSMIIARGSQILDILNTIKILCECHCN